MKLIQIFVLVAALAVAATAQNASSTGQNTGSGAQPGGTANQKQKSAATPASSKPNAGTNSQNPSKTTQAAGVKLIVPKKGAQATPSTSGSASAKSSSTTKGASGVKAGSASKGQVAGKTGAAQKPSMVVVKPVAKPATKAKSTAVTATSKKVPPKGVHQADKGHVRVMQKASSHPASDEAVSTSATASGRRDPFLSVIRTLPNAPSGPNCSVGKRCLYIPELELKGIAKDPDGQMMAVVMSNTRRAYFLRENDQVFNGSVQKITSDSVVFREFVTDHLGRETAHEVVKKIPKS